MVTKGLLYYTDSELPLDIATACRAQLGRACCDYEVGCVSRQPLNFGNWNIVVNEPRGVLTMHRQVLLGLERLETDLIFLCEHDVLYHPSHFDLTPSTKTVFHYNTNIWRVRYPDGHAVWTDELQQTSGCFAYRELLLRFYRIRLAKLEREGFDRHYEPGPKTGPFQTLNWKSKYPNIDIRHSKNLTKSKWSPQEFRNPHYARGWKEASEVEGWGITEGRFSQFIKELS